MSPRKKRKDAKIPPAQDSPKLIKTDPPVPPPNPPPRPQNVVHDIEIVEEQITSLDRAMLRMIAEEPHVSNVAMGKALKVSRETIGARRNRPIFKRAETDIFKPALDILRDSAAEVARNVVKIHRENMRGRTLIDPRTGEEVRTIADPELALRTAYLVLKPSMDGDKGGGGGRPDLGVPMDQLRELAKKVFRERHKK